MKVSISNYRDYSKIKAPYSVEFSNIINSIDSRRYNYDQKSYTIPIIKVDE